MPKLFRKNQTLRDCAFFLKILWEASPGRVVYCIGVNLLHHLYMFVSQILFIQFLINAIQNRRPFREVILFVAAMGAFSIAFHMFEDWYSDSYAEKTNHLIDMKINAKMFRKAAEMDLQCYEDPAYYDLYIKASTQSKEKIVSFLFTLAEAVSCLFSILLTAGFMLTLDPIVILFSLLPLIVSYTLEKKYTKVKYRFNMANVPFSRREDYVKRTVYLNDYAKEYKLYDIFRVMLKNFNDSVNSIKGNVRKYGTKMAVLSFLSSFLKDVLIPLSSMVYITFRMLVSLTLKSGDAIALATAVGRLSWMLFNVTDSVVKFQEYHLYAENLKAFLEYKPKVNPNERGVQAGNGECLLQAENLSFTYAGQTKPTLKNISFTIKPGEKIALVGANGAGKTTLVKLLMRLYDPEEGEIRLNGVNIKDYNLKSYRDLFGTVFQDFKVFAVSVAENILLKSPENQADRQKVAEALELSGFSERLQAMKNGMDTLLTREFDEEGVSLSGGENQKLAIARAFAKDCGILILDEPSSALDPISEYNMYETMLKTTQGKTVLFISHRLSSAVIADRVFLMENGEITEEGPHAELMERNGKYADMFRMQSENYVGASAGEVLL